MQRCLGDSPEPWPTWNEYDLFRLLLPDDGRLQFKFKYASIVFFDDEILSQGFQQLRKSLLNSS